MKKKRSGGGDMKQTGSTMKGKSCSAGVTKQKKTVVDKIPVGFSHSRKSVKGKK